MISIQRDILFDLDLVDAFQDGQTMAHAGDAHFFQLVVFEGDEGFAYDFVFCRRLAVLSLFLSLSFSLKHTH